MTATIDKKKILRALKLFGEPVIAIALAVLLCTLLANQITQIRVSMVQTQTSNITLQRRIETISKMKEDLASIGDKNYAKIQDALISTDNITDIVIAFDELATKYSLRETSTIGNLLDTGIAIQYGSKISLIDYTLTTSASISTMLDFLKDFEKLSFMPVVSGINIIAQSERGWGSRSNISIRGKLYVRQD